MAIKEAAEATPADADRVVRMEKNQAYNPAVSTAEVAEELGTSEEEAFELLEEASGPSGKPVGDTHIWW